jgi:hypothetical protein
LPLLLLLLLLLWYFPGKHGAQLDSPALLATVPAEQFEHALD